MTQETKSKVGGVITGLVILAVGIIAIIYPEAFVDYEASGRRSFLKSAVAWAWGLPGGIIASLIGALVVYLGFTGQLNDDDEEEAATS